MRNALPYFPEIFKNETVFSIGSRLARALMLESNRSNKIFLPNIAGTRNRAYIPRGLGWLAGRLPSHLQLTETGLLSDHTLFGYHSAYNTDEYRSKISYFSATVADRHKVYSLRNVDITSLDRKLAFCSTCHHESRQLHGDVFWDRRHQLPLCFYCPRHGAVLRNSDIPIDAKISGASAASARNCREDSPALVNAVDPSLAERLKSLGRRSIDILEMKRFSSADDIRTAYLDMLWSKGFGRGRKQLDAELVQDCLTHYLAQFSVNGKSLFAEKVLKPWASFLLADPTHIRDAGRHVLFQDFLANRPAVAPSRTRSPRNRRKPMDIALSLKLRCLNPALPSDHSQDVGIVSAKYGIGKLHIRARCHCGFTYSIARNDDGSISRPRLYDFGPTIGLAVDKAAAAGKTRAYLCRELGINKLTLRYQAIKNGFGQNLDSLRKRNQPINGDDFRRSI
jgi:hypothetical protein